MQETSPNRRLEEFIKHPMETPAVELKEWLDPTQDDAKANLACAILALANSGGGHIVIGFTQDSAAYISLSPPLGILEKYDHDCVNSITNRYCDPSFHIECEIVKSHPIILVPGNHSVPIRCKKDGPNMKHVKQNKYYIRRPGPASEEIRTADEWHQLIRRCVIADRTLLMEDLRTIITPSASVYYKKKDDEKDLHNEWVQQSVSRMKTLVNGKYGSMDKGPYASGGWYGAYSFDPPLDEDISMKKLIEKLRTCEGHETGWPIGIFPPRPGQPYPFEQTLEMSLIEEFNDPSSGDFWRASPSGKFIIFRGMQEDSKEFGERFEKPSFNFTTPVWRLTELLLHAHRFADQFSSEEKHSVTVSVDWYGLKERQLVTDSARYGSFHERFSKQDKLHTEIVIPDVSRIQEQLPELIVQLTNPLYEIFNFFEMPMKTIQDEINELQKR